MFQGSSMGSLYQCFIAAYGWIKSSCIGNTTFCLSIWVIPTVWLLTVLLKFTCRLCVSCVFISVGHIPWSGLAGSCNDSVFNILRCRVGLQVSTVIYFLFSMRHCLIIRTLFKSSSLKALLGYSLLTQSYHQIQLEVTVFIFMTVQE